MLGGTRETTGRQGLSARCGTMPAQTWLTGNPLARIGPGDRIQPGTGPSFFVGWARCGSGETCATAVQARRAAAAGIARYKTRMDELLINPYFKSLSKTCNSP
jgi:hypothetical protein